MGAHSSILARKSHEQKSLAGLQSMGLQRVGHDCATKHREADPLVPLKEEDNHLLMMVYMLHYLPSLKIKKHHSTFSG